MLLCASYHYVSAERRRDGRAIFPVSVEALRHQLEVLARAFEFVSRDDLVAAVDGARSLPVRACLVTFDDGLRSQVELALPVLERMGIPAVFFISGRPLLEQVPVHVHRIHRLREEIPDDVLLARLLASEPSLAPLADQVTAAEAVQTYRYDTPSAARVKYLLNMHIDAAVAERLVKDLLEQLVCDDEQLCRDLYATAEQVRELEHRHAAVGAHGHTHLPLALMSPAERDQDLRRGAAVVEAVTGSRPPVISYPYGSVSAVTRDVSSAAQRLGFRAGLTMERALNLSLEDPLLLARLDANDLPTGRRPLLEVGEDGATRVSRSIGQGRRRYFSEETMPATAAVTSL